MPSRRPSLVMIDNFRVHLNKHSSVATIVVMAILVLALGSLARYGMPGYREPGRVWFYDVKCEQYFVEYATNVPPIWGPDQHESVRAHFYSCGECTEELESQGGRRFLGYYEKYSQETKAIIEQNREVLLFARGPIKGRFYSNDGKTWYEDGTDEASEIRKAPRERCTGSVRTCLPPPPPEDETSDETP